MLQVDLRHMLPDVRVPTLVIHRRDAPLISVEGAKAFAAQMPGARYVELDGADTLPYVGDADAVVDQIEQFLTGAHGGAPGQRMLATVLFADVVGSTPLAQALGDRRWQDLLDEYYRNVRRLLERFRGREIQTSGDGFIATFDAPARAVRCALAVAQVAAELGLQVRAGAHTGEIELRGGSISGLAVHIGARVGALAEPGEVLVTGTVKDLVTGSGLGFVDRGRNVLKGVTGEWQLYRAAPQG